MPLMLFNIPKQTTNMLTYSTNPKNKKNHFIILYIPICYTIYTHIYIYIYIYHTNIYYIYVYINNFVYEIPQAIFKLLLKFYILTHPSPPCLNFFWNNPLVVNNWESILSILLCCLTTNTLEWKKTNS